MTTATSSARYTSLSVNGSSATSTCLRKTPSCMTAVNCMSWNRSFAALHKRAQCERQHSCLRTCAKQVHHVFCRIRARNILSAPVHILAEAYRFLRHMCDEGNTRIRIGDYSFSVLRETSITSELNVWFRTASQTLFICVIHLIKCNTVLAHTRRWNNSHVS